MPGITPPLSPGSTTSQHGGNDRPQTMAYALCDSPIGLLAYIVDAIKPPQQMCSPNPTNLRDPWSSSAILNWAMMYWLPGPEGALRWLVNSAPLVPNLWQAYSNVPLAISQFGDQNTAQATAQYIEAYHRIAMVRRRSGASRFPGWDRPMDVVHDLRDFAVLVAPSYFGGCMGAGFGMGY